MDGELVATAFFHPDWFYLGTYALCGLLGLAGGAWALRAPEPGGTEQRGWIALGTAIVGLVAAAPAAVVCAVLWYSDQQPYTSNGSIRAWFMIIGAMTMFLLPLGIGLLAGLAGFLHGIASAAAVGFAAGSRTGSEP